MQDRLIDSFDGTRLHSSIEGPPDAPTVVFSHSIGCDSSSWDAQVAPFVSRYRVVRFDRRGHGRSDVPPGPYTLDQLGRDALAVLDAWGCGRVHYVGLSQGGIEAMWLGTRAPERVARLVIANSTTFMPAPQILQASIERALAEGMAGIASGYLARWLGAEFRAAQPERTAALERRFAAMSPQGFAACLAVLMGIDEREHIRRIVAPTLVITGAAEPPPVLAATEAMAKSIPHAQLTIIAGAAHLSSIENPAGFNAAVLAFLDAA